MATVAKDGTFQPRSLWERKIRYVYALCESLDPFIPRYVGQTSNLQARYRSHLAPSNDSAVSRWVAGFGPPRVLVLEAVERASYMCSQAAEARWIRQLVSDGHDLLNYQNRIDRAVERCQEIYDTQLAGYVRLLINKHTWSLQRKRDWWASRYCHRSRQYKPAGATHA